MTNLINFLTKTPNVKLLDADLTNNYKGGRRYETNDSHALIVKRNSLVDSGVNADCICVSKHGNTYCLEW